MKFSLNAAQNKTKMKKNVNDRVREAIILVSEV